jgi:hypothetical protein
MFKNPRTRKSPPAPFIIALPVTLLLIGFPVYVATQTMSWNSNFPAINLAHITSRSSVVEGSSTATLTLTGDAEISADNTIAARLTESGGDTLVTEYKLAFDGNGSSDTGGLEVGYTSYDSFLTTAAYITHVVLDDEVNVTLFVRASNDPNNVANAGSYAATQTLTASWIGP